MHLENEDEELKAPRYCPQMAPPGPPRATAACLPPIGFWFVAALDALAARKLRHGGRSTVEVQKFDI